MSKAGMIGEVGLTDWAQFPTLVPGQGITPDGTGGDFGQGVLAAAHVAAPLAADSTGDGSSNCCLHEGVWVPLTTPTTDN